MNPHFSKIKYTSPEIKSTISPNIKLIFLGLYCVIIGLLFFINENKFVPFFFMVFLGIIFFGIFEAIASKSRVILITSTYLLMANKIIYFRNIEDFSLNYKSGTIKLGSKLNTIIINKKYFPTESKKEHKIKASQMRRLKKVSKHLIEQIKNVNPSIEPRITE